MAQKVVVELTDDLDGTPAERTVTFGIDGKTYEIDLNAKNEAKLRKAIDPFVAAARRPAGASSRRRAPQPAAEVSTDAVRQWALSNGYEVSARGRIAGTVREAYAAAH